MLFYVVWHLDCIASYLPIGLHLGFSRSWPSLYLPLSFSSLFLVLSFVLASTSVLFWEIPFQHTPLYSPTLSLATTHNSNHCFELVDIGHTNNRITEHRKWEAFIGFCNMETGKITSMMCNNLLKSLQLHRWSRNPLCLWILNFHYHIHKLLPLNLTSNQVKIHLNTIIPATLTSLNWHILFRLSD